VKDINLETPMPSHLMRITSDRKHERDKQNFLTPVHAPFICAHWAKLGRLPEFEPMDICTPVTPNGTEIRDKEYTCGEIPIINLHVNNIQSMPHILVYCYMCNAELLLECMIDPMGKDISKHQGKDLDFEQCNDEWTISKRITANYH
jgi:hypothetical protein